MATESLATALEREHHEIDAAIAAFSAAPQDPQPLLHAIRALRRHIYLEEAFLFPLLREAEAGLMAPIFVMLREHGQIWGVLDALESAAATGAAPALLCKQLTVRLLHHNLKEEKVLYPGADDVLSPAAAELLRAFLASGELPEGWVCAKAQSVTWNAGR
jgi:iron-sulfur cluster repair protein YtfE (RIC family)